MNIHRKTILNDIEIDNNLLSLIQKMWDEGISTVQCCQGGYEEENPSLYTYKNELGKNIQYAHIIYDKKDDESIRKFLPQNAKYFIGSNGNPNKFEYHLHCIDCNMVLFLHEPTLLELFETLKIVYSKTIDLIKSMDYFQAISYLKQNKLQNGMCYYISLSYGTKIFSDFISFIYGEMKLPLGSFLFQTPNELDNINDIIYSLEERLFFTDISISNLKK